jgi:hypothetical protein
MEKHGGIDFFGCRMSFSLVKNGRECVKADIENREGGLSGEQPGYNSVTRARGRSPVTFLR